MEKITKTSSNFVLRDKYVDLTVQVPDSVHEKGEGLSFLELTLLDLFSKLHFYLRVWIMKLYT